LLRSKPLNVRGAQAVQSTSFSLLSSSPLDTRDVQAVQSSNFSLRSSRIAALREEIGHYNGRSSFNWNGEDNQRGRKVWYNCFEKPMKSERHFWATLNYVHHNPVHHGYVKRWQDWPWSSARQYLETVGSEEAKRIWLTYPILDYGKKWDI